MRNGSQPTGRRLPQHFLVLKCRWGRLVKQDECVDDLDGNGLNTVEREMARW